MIRFVRKADFNSLSVKDLLEARDHYHVHLANLPMVIGTAVGRYRIRYDDQNFSDASLDRARPTKALGPRTLENSDIRPWSWPCVLVFVSQWLNPSHLAKHPEAIVPPVLYLPDGRQVRTCVVLVAQRDSNLPSAESVAYSSATVGPGFQLYTEDQGLSKLGVATALATDGVSAFVLASKHVAGIPGTPVFMTPRGRRLGVGQTSISSVDRVPLARIYPGFAGRDAYLTLDASLIRLHNTGAWTAQYLGVGTLGKPVDLSADTISLDLIGCPVFSQLPGGVRVQGAIQGLFYRHATIGGVDSVTEFLIGPRQRSSTVDTRPGDSGAIWFWDHDADGLAELTASAASEKPRPIAVQWGGQGFLSTTGASHSTEFALASSVSAINKALGIDLIRDWGTGQTRYWGKVGHFHIGYRACFALQSHKAKALFETNATLIGVTDEDIVDNKLPGSSSTTQFIALADVPDLVWRSGAHMRFKDKANHFADMDEEGNGDFAGKTLLSLWKSDHASHDPRVWNAFYSSIDPKRKPQHRGALPFRVGQLYGVMTEAVRGRSLEEFLCAAGVLAHYIGDACQPLHISYLHHGEVEEDGDDDVHAVYETDMLAQSRVELVAGVNAAISGNEDRTVFVGAEAAADAVVKLMRRTVDELPPSEVLECYNRVRGAGQAKAMWRELGDRTISRIADGALTLANVWQSAWTEGGGDAGNHFTLPILRTALSKDSLRALYNDPGFAESNWLSAMANPW